MRETSNKDLNFIKKNWDGNPLDSSGRFKNLNGRSERTYLEVLKWQFAKNPFKKKKLNQKSNVEVETDKRFLSDDDNGFTWLGHATFYYTLNKKNIITDPVLGSVGPIKRYTDLPCSSLDLDNIHIILISHNHRDHLDKSSIRQLCKQNPSAVIYTALGIKNLLRKWSIKNKIIEAGWYQKYPELENINISFLPAKHWNRRWLFDLNTMLWGSFMIQYKEHHIYFGADSGIDDHFEEIGKIFPRIDYSMLGIGAYEPNWFMKTAHTGPKDALESHKMLGAKYLFPMHYGTFDLSDEAIFTPKNKIEDLIKNKNLNGIILGKIGEKVYL